MTAMNREEHVTGASLGGFTCNICGARNPSIDASERERASCAQCRSSIRFRSIVLALSRTLFGAELAISDFPVLKSVRGLGMSDSDIYAGRLENRFNYTNTFYHREPRFDLLHPDEREFGQYDFVICSDVLEHVPDPAAAFTTLSRILKPAGVVILSVPYSLEAETIEHFPDLVETGFAEIEGRTVLVGRTTSGEYRVFDKLAFHGGSGATLERRIFSDAGIRAALAAADFPLVQFDASGSREFGVVYSDPCSLPVIAAKAPFVLNASGVTELVEQLSSARGVLRAAEKSRWLRLGRALGLGPHLGLPLP